MSVVLHDGRRLWAALHLSLLLHHLVQWASDSDVEDDDDDDGDDDDASDDDGDTSSTEEMST